MAAAKDAPLLVGLGGPALVLLSTCFMRHARLIRYHLHFILQVPTYVNLCLLTDVHSGSRARFQCRRCIHRQARKLVPSLVYPRCPGRRRATLRRRVARSHRTSTSTIRPCRRRDRDSATSTCPRCLMIRSYNRPERITSPPPQPISPPMSRNT